MSRTISLVPVSRQSPGLLASMRRGLAAVRSYWRGPFNLKDPALNELFGVGTRTLAGPVVNEFTAFTCAAFWDGVTQQSEDVAKMPLNLHKRRKNGGSDHYTDSKLYKLLKFRPNPYTGSLVFRRTMTAYLRVYGNAYAEIERDNIGRPAALWILHPNRVQPVYEDRGGRQVLRYRVDGTTMLEPSDVLHLQGLGDGTQGIDMISVAREAIGLALASQQFASAFFGNGTRFGGVLYSDQDIDDGQADQILARVEKLHAKADKAFRLLVLGQGFKFTESGVKPNEAQMKEIRDQQVTEIARFLNMPLHKLKLNTPGAVSYASVEMADLDYYKGPILTLSKLWEEELDAKLISPFEYGLQYFKHNTNSFLRGDIKSRYDALGIARDKGIINANEWRELEDMNPQEGNQGEEYLVQTAQTPLRLLASLAEAEIDAKKAGAEKDRQPPPTPTPPAGDGGGDAEVAERAARAEAALVEVREALKVVQERTAAVEMSAFTTAEERNEARVAERQAADRVAELIRAHAEEAERAARAEASLTEVREALRVAREQAVIIETSLASTAEEREAARAAERAAALLAAQLEVIANDARAGLAEVTAERTIERAQAEAAAANLRLERDANATALATERAANEAAIAHQAELRGQLHAATDAKDAAEGRCQMEAAARAEAESKLSEAVLDAANVKVLLEHATNERDAAQAQAASAEQIALETGQKLSDASGVVAALEADKAATVEQLEAARAAEVTARIDADAATARLAELREEFNAKADAVDEAQRLLEQANDTAATILAERDAARVAQAEAESARDAAETARVEAESRAVQAETRLAAEQAGREAAEQAERVAEQRVAEQRQAIADRLAAIIPSHRTLIVDAMRRIVSREVTQARRAQATPEKLRRWLATVDEHHVAICRDILTPALAVHLVWMGRAADVQARTAAEVDAHLELFRAQLALATDAEPDEFHAVLERVLTRWETDHPERVADQILGEEINHVRGH